MRSHCLGGDDAEVSQTLHQSTDDIISELGVHKRLRFLVINELKEIVVNLSEL